MHFTSHFRPALEVLLQHRVRSGLTVLGITIGISSTVIMLALGHGMQDQIEQTFTEAGVTLLTVTGRRPPDVQGASNAHKLRWEDYQALVEPGNIPYLVTAMPLASNLVTIRWQDRQVRARMIGVTTAYLSIAGHRLALGDFLSEEDNRGMRLVGVLGSGLASSLYAQNTYPLGTSLTVEGKRLEIIGVMAHSGTEADYQIIVPFHTLQKRLRRAVTVSGSPLMDEIQVRVQARHQVADARQVMQEVLRWQRGIGPLEHDNFRITTLEAGREAVQDITRTLTVFLATIASISLFVGGVGVTNIMLVSLGERTREIGIRYAVGATVRDITLMFLLESILLCGAGGVIGVSLCAYGVVLIRVLADVPAKLSLNILLLALFVSMTVGLLSGIYPALRARRVTPSEALRSL